MRKRYGSKRRAKEELLARYASFIYLGNGATASSGLTVLFWQTAGSVHWPMTPTRAALLAGITKVAGRVAPTLANNQKPLRRRNQILALMVKNHFISARGL